MTVKEILDTLPGRLKMDKVDADTYGLFHFDMDGENGGQYSVKLENQQVVVEDGFQGEPTCVIQSKAETFIDIETGKTNPQMAFRLGKIKVSNLGEMLKFLGIFAKLEEN
jgi:putative sterol carrier protein